MVSSNDRRPARPSQCGCKAVGEGKPEPDLDGGGKLGGWSIDIDELKGEPVDRRQPRISGSLAPSAPSHRVNFRPVDHRHQKAITTLRPAFEEVHHFSGSRVAVEDG